jgi:hypothetical protein
MSFVAGAGSRKETSITIDDVAKRFTAMEESLCSLQPLVEKV